MALLPAGAVTLLFDIEIPLPWWGVLLALAGIGGLLHFVVLRSMRTLARRSASALDDLLVEIASRVLPLWIALSMVLVAFEGLKTNHPAVARVQPWAVRAVYIAAMLSLFWALGRLLFGSLARWAQQNAPFAPIYPLVRFLLKVLIVVVGGLTVLSYLNIDITAMAATLGIGGVAVAFALQDTLSNFFAGLHLMSDRPILEGDVVQLHDTGDRGTVVKIGWRSTRVRNVDNNIVVIPNSRIVSGVITNLSTGDRRMVVRVVVGVAYGSDPDLVARCLVEEAAACAGKVPGLPADCAPVALLHPGFGPSSLDFTLSVTVDGFEFGGPVQDALRRRILRRFAAEGIAIPFPHTVVLHRPADEPRGR
jgi:small-conductance mechanosensitive channel